MAIDFTPTLVGYSNQEKLRFWCQKVLPLVYDDSLSYYELLNKVVLYLNNAIQDVANAETNIDSLFDSFNELQDYVNSFGDEISAIDENVAAALRAKLDAETAKADAESAKDDAESAKADAESAKNDVTDMKTSIEETAARIEQIADDFRDSRWIKFIPPTVKGIAHRGFSFTAPENTIPAFIEAMKEGFKFVETDVQKTSDGVYVILHDSTINRTARNADGSTIAETINIADITYAQANSYDYGIWKGEQFAGTKIPTLAEFLDFCKYANLYPYIEIKNEMLQTDIEAICDMLWRYNMQNTTTVISFSKATLTMVKNYEPSIRLGLNCSVNNLWSVTDVLELVTATNEVFLHCQVSYLYDHYETLIADCVENHVGLEVWTPDNLQQIIDLLPYVGGVTSNWADASRIAREIKNLPDIKAVSADDFLTKRCFTVGMAHAWAGKALEIDGNKVRLTRFSTGGTYGLANLTGKPLMIEATTNDNNYRALFAKGKIPITAIDENNFYVEIEEESYTDDPTNGTLDYSIVFITVDASNVVTIQGYHRNPMPNVARKVKYTLPTTFYNAALANGAMSIAFYSRSGGIVGDILKVTLTGINGITINNNFFNEST